MKRVEALFFCYFSFLLLVCGYCSETRRKLEENDVKFTIFELKIPEENVYLLNSSYEAFHLRNVRHDKNLFHNDFVHFDISDDHVVEKQATEVLNCIQTSTIHDISNQNVGTARINACHNQFSAHLHFRHNRSLNVETHNETHLIGYEENKLSEEWNCGHNDDNHYHSNFFDSNYKDNRFLFDVEIQSRIKFVKLLVVNDNARFQQHGISTSSNSAHLIQRLQHLYDKLGTKFLSMYPASEAYLIKISIVGMVNFKTEDPWSSKLGRGSVDAHKLLEAFAEWKSLQSADTPSFPSHSVGHLISGRDFEGGTVGLANLFAICKTQVSVAVNQAAGFQDETVATIMAHELAHNLGVYHTDTTHRGSLVSSPCGGFIMDSNGIRNTEWSKCSVNYLKMFFDGHPEHCEGSHCTYPRRYGIGSYPACLEQPPERVWCLEGSDSVCGNGVKENDEQCDCGQDDCSEIDPCCDGKTCTFLTDDYECSDLDLCCHNCFIAPKASPKEAIPCREAVSDCDVPEYCDGQSAVCPFDDFKTTGTSCYDEELDAEGSCFIGNCNSHKSQCLDYSYLGFDGPCTR